MLVSTHLMTSKRTRWGVVLMTLTAEARAIFQDAYDMHRQALNKLDAGDIRDAAEKAWCATKRATDALILTRTGQEPRHAGHTTRRIRSMREADPALRDLSIKYGDRAHNLHGTCFYEGNCEPLDALTTDIRETLDYIQEAERLAEAQA